VPRKQRNQASNSDHIEFAAEITTSLLGQVRHLQAVLAERDEALKTTNADKSKLELEAEGFTQRLRQLDDSEQRYKDENWNLETQLQEAQAAAREAASRENRLQQGLATKTTEHSSAQRELEDLRQSHGKVTEEYAAVRKTHEQELASLRKNANLGETEKGALQRKIDELTSQNQELARGIASHLRAGEVEPTTDVRDFCEEDSLVLSEREHSPPPSPTKSGQRHSMLESETLKSSLHHAHRMIQNLKGNVHREKSEKQDLKRMLQEARDELELRRAEPNEKRLKSKSQQDMRKAGRPLLGATRNSRTDILFDDPEHDPDWEDHNGNTPNRDLGARSLGQEKRPAATRSDTSDAYQTANETEDAFETANERDTTDNDAFQTGAESIAGDSSEETETESGVARAGTVRGKKGLSQISTKQGNRRSIQSTASTSDDDAGIHTPVQGQPQKFRLKLNRNNRKSRVGSEALGSAASTAKNSPASFVNAGGEPGQSLAAELENRSGDEADGTPSKGSISSPRSTQSLRRTISDKRSSSSMRRSPSSQPSTPGLKPSTMASEIPPVPRIPTVDSGMMTEPWEPKTGVQSGTQAGVGEATPGTTSSATLPTSSAAAIASRIFGGSPSTPQNKALDSQPASRLASTSTSPSTPPRPVWDQPLQMFSGVIPGLNQSTDTTPLSTRSTASEVKGVPESATGDDTVRGLASDANGGQLPLPFSPPLALSPIQSVETSPTQKPAKSEKEATPASADPSSRRSTDADSGGILGSVFGWRRSTSTAAPAPQIAKDETSQDFTPVTESANTESKKPLQEVPANTVTRNVQDPKVLSSRNEVASVYKADQGSQTVLSSEQIDSIMRKKDTPSPPSDSSKTPATAAMAPLSRIGAVSPPSLNRGFQESPDPAGKGKAPEMVTYRDSLGKTFKRPASTTSVRSRTSQYPPLPPDHQEAIAAAAEKVPAVMGPPIAPASAYPGSARSRAGSRPQTPSQQGYPSPSSKGGTTPRAGRYSTTRSQVSRRSSVSSFASELDERFNIRTDGMPMPQGISSGTDPRMIQAITQTMIGEMMWKYTRKAGRGEMSNTRHRRFFWVHPYTRTLYWSDRDPATANRAELKSKSVAIEAVRVVTDDNPMPPGLHRKSLIIVTPGRSVKFTAQTSQRHATWFNALSYLLLRTGPDGSTTNNAGDITDADVEEFNPGYNRRSARSRVSIASFKSQASQNRNLRSSLSSRAPAAIASGSQTHLQHLPESEDEGKPTGSIRRRISRSLSRSRGSKAVEQRESQQAESSTANSTPHASIGSRISGYWSQKPSIRGSMRSRSSMRENSVAEPGVLEGGRSVVQGGGDSAEDLRRVIEQRESKGDLENVRACCDGMFTPLELCSMEFLEMLTYRGQVDMTWARFRRMAGITARRACIPISRARRRILPRAIEACLLRNADEFSG